MRQSLFLTFIFIVLCIGLCAGQPLHWEELAQLPPAAGKTDQPGLAGAFAGVHNNALIIAGGANFPEGFPWNTLADGSEPRKIYNRDIYVLEKDGSWKISDVKLPAGYSYGVSIPTEDGLICIGGEWRRYDADGRHDYVSDNIFVLRHRGNGEIVLEDAGFPKLPEAVSAMAGARIGNNIYILGGHNGKTETKNFWRINLTAKDHWENLEPWPGLPRSHLVTVAQSDGKNDCLYMFSGRCYNKKDGWQLLSDGYKYEPDINRWTKMADVGTNLENRNGICVMAGAGIKLGANHIAVFGGDSGEIFRKVAQDIPDKIKILLHEDQTTLADQLRQEKKSLLANHPGFSRDILVYHTITDTWTKSGQLPESEIMGGSVGGPVTTTAVYWDEDIILPSGEVRPGVRSPKIWIASPDSSGRFGIINFFVLGLYLGALVSMGFYFSKREKSTDDFFKAGGRVPWWAAGLSIFGTQLSAITFMAIPAKSFATDWTWFMMNMTIIIVAPFIVYFFLPFYRRLNVTTAYEYIERRFNIVVRVTASAMFMVFQFARIGIVLYLPSIALSVVTGVDINTCIIVMCLLSIAYTVLGGIEAVIWTDVIQVFVLLGGALLVLLMIPAHTQEGFNGMVGLAMDADKLRLFDFHFNMKSPTLWVLVFGGIGANLISYGSDQTVIQRYLTTKDEKAAARGIWTNGILSIPASIIFFGLGTALYTFYKSYPQELDATLQLTDAIFPWFIVTQLPAGVAGLLIAGIFAAAMSSLDSSMNSVATAFTTDFYRRFKPGVTDKRCLAIARIVTVVIGLCGMIFALAMATWDIKSLWNEFTKYIGLFGGGLGGLFLLAIFTRKASWKGAMIGLLISAIIQYYLQAADMVHGVLFAATGLIACLVTGYAASLFLPDQKKELQDLTIYTLQK